MPKLPLLAATLAAAALAGGAAPAGATTLKTTGGATLASNTAISGALKGGTTSHLEGGASGDIDCSASSLTATVGTNPNTPSVTGSLTSLTFGSCTDTIPFVTASAITTNVGTGANAKTVTWIYLGPTSVMAVSGLAFTLTFSSGATCVYQRTTEPATATDNGNGEYSFNVPMTETSGTFVCPSNVTWTATYVLVRSSDGARITTAA